MTKYYLVDCARYLMVGTAAEIAPIYKSLMRKSSERGAHIYPRFCDGCRFNPCKTYAVEIESAYFPDDDEFATCFTVDDASTIAEYLVDGLLSKTEPERVAVMMMYQAAYDDECDSLAGMYYIEHMMTYGEYQHRGRVLRAAYETASQLYDLGINVPIDEIKAYVSGLKVSDDAAYTYFAVRHFKKEAWK